MKRLMIMLIMIISILEASSQIIRYQAYSVSKRGRTLPGDPIPWSKPKPTDVKIIYNLDKKVIVIYSDSHPFPEKHYQMLDFPQRHTDDKGDTYMILKCRDRDNNKNECYINLSQSYGRNGRIRIIVDLWDSAESYLVRLDN